MRDPDSLEIVVYGASGFGQQVMFWLRDAAQAGPSAWRPIGFVDDDASAHGATRSGLPVLGGFGWLERRVSTAPLGIVIGIAAPKIKQRLVDRLRRLGVAFPTVVHPSAVIAEGATIGSGVLVAAGCVVSVNAVLEDFVIVNHACTIAHDAHIGAYSTVLPGTNVSGNVVLGEGTTLGTNSAVIQGVTIGEGAIVGAGATVLDDLPAHCTAVGTPAVPIRFREPA